MISYNNPYRGNDFWQFWVTLIQRLWAMMSGQIGFHDLASDEIQVLVLMGVAISASLVGAFLILRRMAMLANSLSHTILLGIVLAYLLTVQAVNPEGEHAIDLKAMLIASLLTGLATTFFTEFLTKTVRLQEDASTGLVFSSLFALGVLLATLFTRDAHIGIEVVMGNVDALHADDLRLVYTILLANVVLIGLFFKEYKLTTFDGALARSMGISTVFFNYLLMVQVSATAVGAFRAVGVLMVLAFIIGPALMARLLTHRLLRLLFWSMGIGAFVSVVGVALSRHLLTVHRLALSTGGVVVCLIVLLYAALLVYTQVTTGKQRSIG